VNIRGMFGERSGKESIGLAQGENEEKRDQQLSCLRCFPDMGSNYLLHRLAIKSL